MAEGLVRIERNRGASVTEVTPELVAELVEVRGLLEGLNARLAAQRHDPAIVAQLEEVLKRGDAAADIGGIAGGGVDAEMRLIAQFFSRHVPGAPNIQPMNMPGAGGILLGNYLYTNGGGTLMCIEFSTGKTAWQARSIGKGSLLAADGMLYQAKQHPQPLVFAEVLGRTDAGVLPAAPTVTPALA